MNEIVKNRLKELSDNVIFDEPMSRHTTFKVGGVADAYVEVMSKEELINLLDYLTDTDVPYYIVGNGSNLLVADDGFRGVIIATEHMRGVEVTGNRITCEAGCLLSVLANTAYKNALTGLEFAQGIPGTVGGAMVMNAGAYGGEMSRVVESVTVYDIDRHKVIVLKNTDMEFSYRHSVISGSNLIVLSAVFLVEKGESALIKDKMDDFSSRRRDKQPLEYPSAGSTFKRPEGFFAGALIEESGLKGYSVGGAQVSEKHAGFVINKSNATASDVYNLICEVREKVFADSGVRLEPEVIMLGKF